jgi:histidine ammonia-lyase
VRESPDQPQTDRPLLVLDGAGLTCPELAAAAHGRRRIELADGVLPRVAAAHARAVELVASRHVYGRTTGVGANRDVTLDEANGAAGAKAEEAHVRSLLRSHATASGPARSPERVRGMLVVRLHQLAAGASGASAEVVAALLAMVQADALPTVRELGSIGTGDLAPLAAAALALSGENPTTHPLRTPVRFGIHDAVPFMSSGAATIADSALAQQELHGLARATVVVAALSFTATRGNPEAFSVAVERVAPFPGVRQVCRWMRELIDDTTPGVRLQDPFGLRTLPQVHGTLLDTLDHLARVTEALADHASENPLVVARSHRDEADPETDVPHHGAFHLASLATALDTARSTVVQSGQLALRRLGMLVEPRYTALQPFLSDGTPGSSGVMPLEYVAASALAQLRALTAPVGGQSVTLSRGAEDDASFASTGARMALDAVDPLRVLLACELVAAVRAVRQLGASASSTTLAQALDLAASLPADVHDRDLSADVDTAGRLLDGLADLLPGAGTLDAT